MGMRHVHSLLGRMLLRAMHRCVSLCEFALNTHIISHAWILWDSLARAAVGKLTAHHRYLTRNWQQEVTKVH